MTRKGLPQSNLKIEDLKPGDILLFPPNKLGDNGWVGQAIILLTGGQVSHSAVFRGEKDGQLKVAHAEPKGIVSESFIALLESEPGCYVKRHSIKTDLNPVLSVVEKYTDHDNPYPFLNLGVLGLLILENRFSEKTLKNRVFYDFTILIGLKIMKMVEKHKHAGKTPMTCSQFAAQCFTDAGDEYDIKFNKLLIQFGSFNSVIEEDSLLNILNTEDFVLNSQENTIEIEPNTILNREDEIVSDFMQLIEIGETNSAVSVTRGQLGIAGKMLLNALSEALTGKKPSSTEDAIKQLSTNRNYYVTPDDLLSNSNNLTAIGYIDKSVL